MLKIKLLSPLIWGVCGLAGLFSATGLKAAERTVDSPPNVPFVAGASDEAELALRRFVIPRGFKAELFAAEPDLANPVAFWIDEKGRFYVCETFRHSDGVLDIRGRMHWLDEDLAARTVDDRLAMLKRHLGGNLERMTRETERIRLIEDLTGDGRADRSTVFADGFNGILDGIAAGILARKGDVYFGNIPDLWLLRDTTGDGVADLRKSLHHGFGVRVGFLGHDLHGLRFGPDGKLYFSLGDRGARVKTERGYVGDPDTGSIFRCNPDGSDLEMFATGLRNPQEIIFDRYGNLFTGDNDSDGGDRARWVYLVEGGDSGWHIGYQFLEAPYRRGPWNAEKLWHPHWEGQAAYIVPPIANLGNGPSGLTYNPGTGMPEEYDGHFFLCDFRGGAGSGVHAFAVAPKGASFELVNHSRFVWEILATDVDFGVEGGIYVSDWVEGWGKPGKGRIYRFYDPEVTRQPIVRETKRLIGEGMENRSLKALARLLAHPDMRVRQEAQFELAERGMAGRRLFAEVARKSRDQLARLHAIWGLGQTGGGMRTSAGGQSAMPGVEEVLTGLLGDADAEVRAQAAKVLGDLRAGGAFDGLVRLLADESPRVRFFAAQSLGKLRRVEAVEPVLAMLRENADRDPYLRHAGAAALARINDMDALNAAAGDHSASARMGVLLALRQLGRGEVGRFLGDSEPLLVLEAARAINDVPISGAMIDLARLAETKESWAGRGMGGDDFQHLFRRVINANLRVGLEENARALAEFAVWSGAPEALRREALLALADWPAPSGRDRVTGLWRPVVGPRPREAAAEALRPALATIARESPGSVQAAAVRAVERLGMAEAGAELFELARTGSPAAKVAALKALAAFQDQRLAEALNLAAADGNERVRNEAMALLAQFRPAGVLEALRTLLDSGSIGEQQNALRALGDLEEEAADRLLVEQWDRMSDGELPLELHLDLIETSRKRSHPDVQSRLRGHEASLPEDDHLAGFREVLYGGDPIAGREIFFERVEVSCLRCHQVEGEGGGEAGPDLTGLGLRRSREHILESILFPNREITEGYENLVITLEDGTVLVGLAAEETETELTLNSPEDGLVTIEKSEIESRDRGLSGMPEGMREFLSKQDLRNLIEYLSSLGR